MKIEHDINVISTIIFFHSQMQTIMNKRFKPFATLRTLTISCHLHDQSGASMGLNHFRYILLSNALR